MINDLQTVHKYITRRFYGFLTPNKIDFITQKLNGSIVITTCNLF